MLCTNCGQLSADSSRCEHCQAPLPDRQQTPPYQNGPLLDIHQLLHLWDSQIIELPEFLERVQSKRDFYKESLGDLANLQVAEEVKAEIAEELQVGRIGLESLLRALDEVENYARTASPHYREQALAAADSATKMLNRALQLNWQSYSLLQESMEEMLELARRQMV